MTQSWILEKKRQENFPQQHVLLAPPAAQLLHCNCRQRITVRIQFLSLSFRFYISLETLLAYSKMLLGWNTGINADSVQICTLRLAVFHEVTEHQVWPKQAAERGSVFARDEAGCIWTRAIIASLLPPFFLSPLPADENFMAPWKADFWGLNQPAPLNFLPCHYRPDWRHPFVWLLLERWVPEEGLTRPTTSQLLQHWSHDTTSHSYTWGGYWTNVSLFALIVSVYVDFTGSRHKNTICQPQLLLNFSDEDLCFTLDRSPSFLWHAGSTHSTWARIFKWLAEMGDHLGSKRCHEWCENNIKCWMQGFMQIKCLLLNFMLH